MIDEEAKEFYQSIIPPVVTEQAEKCTEFTNLLKDIPDEEIIKALDKLTKG